VVLLSAPEDIVLYNSPMPLISSASRLPILLCLVIEGICTAQRPVQLLRLPSLSSKAESLPRIAHPNQFERIINHDLLRLDTKAKRDALGCTGASDDGHRMFYERSVNVLSPGPRYLAIAVNVSTDCGGVHPYYYQFTLTYDVETGRPVDWAKILMKTDAKNDKVNPDSELPFALPAVRSRSLQKLYRAGWKDADQCSVDDIASAAPSEDSEFTSFMLAPVPEKHGLSVLPVNLSSSVAACAQPVILGRKAMDELGISGNF
jgi:hypothetical protein